MMNGIMSMVHALQVHVTILDVVVQDVVKHAKPLTPSVICVLTGTAHSVLTIQKELAQSALVIMQ